MRAVGSGRWLLGVCACVLALAGVIGYLLRSEGEVRESVDRREGAGILDTDTGEEARLLRDGRQRAASVGFEESEGVPEFVLAGRVLGRDFVDLANGGWRRRSIVETDTRYGRVLLVEFGGGGVDRAVELYAAEHAVVFAADEAGLVESRQVLETAGYEVRRPFEGSLQLFLVLEGAEPAELYGMLAAVGDTLGESAGVEFDAIGSGGALPNDANYSRQWSHGAIEMEGAWEFSQGSSEIVVAILDTGVREATEEFSGRMVAGYDFVNSDDDADDDQGHGTAVAGVIGANANNGFLVAGVDWNCRLMPVKVLDEENNGLYSDWTAGIDFALENGARVINLSAGGSTVSRSMELAIDRAIASGCIFVTITHNDSAHRVRFPGRYEPALTVGATERNGVKTDFSNWGPEIDLVAPGRDIYTVSTSGQLTYWWGTSFAAPQVAGVAALLLAMDPELDQAGVETLLFAGAVDRVGDGDDVVGFDERYGWGMLNAHNSLLLAGTRLEAKDMGDGTLALEWDVTATLADRRPYRIQFSDNLKDWDTVEDPEILFGERARWETRMEDTRSRFYRLLIGNY